MHKFATNALTYVYDCLYLQLDRVDKSARWNYLTKTFDIPHILWHIINVTFTFNYLLSVFIMKPRQNSSYYFQFAYQSWAL